MFGQPTRTAAKDANDGNTAISSAPVPTQSRLSSGQLMTRPDSGAPGVANIALSIAETEVSEYGKRRDQASADEAAFRQGQSEAINEIDANRKRSGLSKWLFGQDAGYATAQRLAVQNSVNTDYQELLISSKTDAPLTEQEYKQKLWDVRSERLMKFENDPDAQNLIMKEWIPVQNKLAREQAIAHYEYGQEQAHIEGVKQSMSKFDNWQLEMHNDSSNISQGKARKEYTEYFRNPTVDPEATPEASKLIKLEAVTRSLSSGNMAAYNVMMEEGTFYDSLSPAQLNIIDGAIAKADGVRESEMLGITSSAETAALEGDMSAYTNAVKDLQAMRPNLSGTQRSENSWNKAKNTVLKKQRLLEDEAVKKVHAEQEGALDVMALASGDAARIGARGMTPKREKAAADKWVLGTLSSLNPEWDAQSDVDTEEAANYLLRNEPELVNGTWKFPMEVVGKGLEMRGVSSPLVSSLVTTVIGSYGLGSERGTMHPKKMEQLKAVSRMKQVAPQLFKSSLDADAYDTLAIIERGMGKDVASIQNDINSYRANKHLAGSLTAASMGLQSGQTKYDWLKNIVTGMQGAAPDDRTMQYYAEELDRGFMITQSVQGAREYVATSIRDRNIQYNGKVIPNGKFLEDSIDLGSTPEGDRDVTIPDVLQQLNGTPLLVDLFKQRIPDLAQDPLNKFSEWSQIPGIEFGVNLSNNSLEIKSPSFMYPISLSADQLREAGELARESRAFKQNQEKQILQRAIRDQSPRMGFGPFGQ